MKITKFGHCCLLIEEAGVRILTDPGTFTSAQDELKNLDLVLITHEHQDHFHIDSVKKIVSNNPEATIITNAAVGKLLDEQNIVYKKISNGEKASIKNVLIEGFGF
ncbi:MAG TPA: MBL fold metallo-hydrolase, partial [Methylomirabilota bacterium]|nr:MBL fold metallo-hydrolase [Methylomirabilota bacterium]